MAFIEDYRLTSCMGILKYALQKHRGEPDIEIDVHITSAKELESLKAQVADDESEDNDGRLSVVLSRLDSAGPTPKTPKDSSQPAQKSQPLLNQNEIAAIEPIKSINDPHRSNSTIGQQAAKPHRSVTIAGDEQEQDTKASQNLCN
jgi:hypothetical protein